MNKLTDYILISAILIGGSLSAQNEWTLESCIDHAMQNNIQVMQSALSAKLSQIDFEQSKLARFPTLNAGATHGYNWGQAIDPFTNEFASDRVRNNNFFLTSGVPIFQGFQINKRIEQAKLDRDAALLDVQELKNNIGLAVAQGYLNVLFNKELLRVAESQLDISNQQVDRMEKMVEAGQMAIGSLYDLQSQQASDALQKTNALNNLEISKVNLMTLLQLSFSESQNFDIVMPDIEKSSETQLLDVMSIYNMAKEQLPQLKSAETRMRSSEIGTGVAKGSLLPSLDLSGSLGSGYSGNNLLPVGDPVFNTETIGVTENTLEPVITIIPGFSEFETKSFTEQLEDNFNQSLSLRLSIPIFNGLQARTNLQRAQIQQELAQLDFDNVSNTLYQDIQQAHANMIAADNSFRSAEKAVQSMRQNFTNAQKRFEQNMINSVDFNDAKNRLTQAESQLIRAKYDLVFRKTILDFYTGKPIKL